MQVDQKTFKPQKLNPHDENDRLYVGKVHADEPDDDFRVSGRTGRVGSPTLANPESADAAFGN